MTHLVQNRDFSALRCIPLMIGCGLIAGRTQATIELSLIWQYILDFICRFVNHGRNFRV